MNATQKSEFRDILQLLETYLKTPHVSGKLKQ